MIIRPKTLTSMMFAAGLFTVAPAFALGFGQAKVISEIGQPFRAEISLKLSGSETFDSIGISQAPTSEYERQAVPFNSALSNMRVSLRSVDGVNTAILTTLTPINEAGLAFILQGETAQGRMARSFNLQIPTSALTKSYATASVTSSSAVTVKEAVIAAEKADAVKREFDAFAAQDKKIYDYVIETGTRPAAKNIARVKKGGKNEAVVSILSKVVPKQWKGFAADGSIHKAKPMDWVGSDRLWIEVVNEVLSASALSATVNWDKKEITFRGQNPVEEYLPVKVVDAPVTAPVTESVPTPVAEAVKTVEPVKVQPVVEAPKVVVEAPKAVVEAPKDVEVNPVSEVKSAPEVVVQPEVKVAAQEVVNPFVEVAKSEVYSPELASSTPSHSTVSEARAILRETYQADKTAEQALVDANKHFEEVKASNEILHQKFSAWEASASKLASPSLTTAASIVAANESALQKAFEDQDTQELKVQTAGQNAASIRSETALQIALRIAKQGGSANHQSIASQVIAEFSAESAAASKQVVAEDIALNQAQKAVIAAQAKLAKSVAAFDKLNARSGKAKLDNITANEGKLLKDQVLKSDEDLKTSLENAQKADLAHQNAHQTYLQAKQNMMAFLAGKRAERSERAAALAKELPVAAPVVAPVVEPVKPAVVEVAPAVDAAKQARIVKEQESLKAALAQTQPAPVAVAPVAPVVVPEPVVSAEALKQARIQSEMERMQAHCDVAMKEAHAKAHEQHLKNFPVPSEGIEVGKTARAIHEMESLKKASAAPAPVVAPVVVAPTPAPAVVAPAPVVAPVAAPVAAQAPVAAVSAKVAIPSFVSYYVSFPPGSFSNVDIYQNEQVEAKDVRSGGFNVSLYKAVNLIAPKGWSTMTQDPKLANVDSATWKGLNRPWLEVLNELMAANHAKAYVNPNAKEIVLKSLP